MLLFVGARDLDHVQGVIEVGLAVDLEVAIEGMIGKCVCSIALQTNSLCLIFLYLKCL